MEIARTLENAEKAFFLVRPHEDSGKGASTARDSTSKAMPTPREKDKGNLTAREKTDMSAPDEEAGDHLKQLRKVLQSESKDYNVVRRRRMWQRNAQRDQQPPSHSPVFLKRTHTTAAETEKNIKTPRTKPGPYRNKASKFRSKLYASNPAISNYRNVTNAMGGNLQYSTKKNMHRSMPDRINLITGNPNNLHPVERFLQHKKLPKIKPQNVMFSDQILGGEEIEEDFDDEEEEVVQDEDKATEGGGKETNDEYEETYTETASTTNTQAIKADWLLEECLKEEMRKFERQKKRLMINTGSLGLMTFTHIVQMNMKSSLASVNHNANETVEHIFDISVFLDHLCHD